MPRSSNEARSKRRRRCIELPLHQGVEQVHDGNVHAPTHAERLRPRDPAARRRSPRPPCSVAPTRAWHPHRQGRGKSRHPAGLSQEPAARSASILSPAAAGRTAARLPSASARRARRRSMDTTGSPECSLTCAPCTTRACAERFPRSSCRPPAVATAESGCSWCAARRRTR